MHKLIVLFILVFFLNGCSSAPLLNYTPYDMGSFIGVPSTRNWDISRSEAGSLAVIELDRPAGEVELLVSSPGTYVSDGFESLGAMNKVDGFVYALSSEKLGKIIGLRKETILAFRFTSPITGRNGYTMVYLNNEVHVESPLTPPPFAASREADSVLEQIEVLRSERNLRVMQTEDLTIKARFDDKGRTTERLLESRRY